MDPLIVKLDEKPEADLTLGEIELLVQAGAHGGMRPGELSIEDGVERLKILDSPFHMATQMVDSYYEREFEYQHQVAMDEVMGPYIRGEDFKIEDTWYDPEMVLGLLCLFSRDTFKSSMAWMMLLYGYLHYKLVLKKDARAMYVHQVQKKAIKRGDNIRNCARNNRKFRRLFPEFHPPAGEWDTKEEWSWPNYKALSSGESSFIAYGETSDKTGGHYNLRVVDDWESESLKTAQARMDNFDLFGGMEPLEDSTEGFSPYLIPGTTYAYDGTHQRLLMDGGYATWVIPAFKGSPKKIFDMCAEDPRTKSGKRRIEEGIKLLENTRQGDLNFPKRLPWRSLYKKARGQGPQTFNCQMLINPVPAGEQRFNTRALESGWIDKIPLPEEMWLYLRCDPAISEKKSADESAYVMGGVTWDGKRVIVDGWIGREKQPTELIKIGFDLVDKWQQKGYTVRSLGYEAVQYQAALANMGRYGIPAHEPKFDGELVPMRLSPCKIVAIHRSSEMSKPERIISMDGPICRRELKFWKSCRIAEKVMNQFLRYPFDKFDALDATHDLWVKTRCPPRTVDPETKYVIPKEIQAILDNYHSGDDPVTKGTSNTIKLENWR